jgi:hypothetical protein
MIIISLFTSQRGGMVDTTDSKSVIFGCAGSSPAAGTTNLETHILGIFQT